MRLAFISPFGFTPKATLSHRILPIAKALTKKGHEINIVIPPYTNPEYSGFVENCDGVKLININLPGRLFYSIRVGLRMARIVKEFNPDRIFVFKPKGYGALAVIFLYLTAKRYPLYLDVDDLEFDKNMEQRMKYGLLARIFFRYEERWLLKRAGAITTASRFLEAYYGDKAGKERVRYLPNGPVEIGGLEERYSHEENNQNTAEALRRKLELNGKRVVLLYTRFSECGLADIIDFVQAFSKKYPTGILLIIGEGYGREREKVLDGLRKRGISDFVRFSGWVKREELKNYLSLGEAAIYPMADTDFNRAKCSAKLIELMSAGKAVVASPVGEVLTYIKDKETGLISRDTKEMADKVIGLLEDREKNREIGENARQYIYNNFNWDKLITIFSELI